MLAGDVEEAGIGGIRMTVDRSASALCFDNPSQHVDIIPLILER